MPTIYRQTTLTSTHLLLCVNQPSGPERAFTLALGRPSGQEGTVLYLANKPSRPRGELGIPPQPGRAKCYSPRRSGRAAAPTSIPTRYRRTRGDAPGPAGRAARGLTPGRPTGPVPRDRGRSPSDDHPITLCSLPLIQIFLGRSDPPPHAHPNPHLYQFPNDRFHVAPWSRNTVLPCVVPTRGTPRRAGGKPHEFILEGDAGKRDGTHLLF